MMSNRKKWILMLFVSFPLIFGLYFVSAKTDGHKTDLKSGKYTTINLGYPQIIKFGLKYRDKFSNWSKMMLDLRPDSTFQLGFCDNKVIYEGKWKQKNDTLTLSKCYSYWERKPIKDILLKLDLENGYIFYPLYHKKKGTKSDFKRTITVLKIGGTGFDGELDQGYRWGPDSTAQK